MLTLVLPAAAPDVLNRVPQVEVHVLRDLYALHSAGMARVVTRMVHFVVHTLLPDLVLDKRSLHSAHRNPCTKAHRTMGREGTQRQT